MPAGAHAESALCDIGYPTCPTGGGVGGSGVGGAGGGSGNDWIDPGSSDSGATTDGTYDTTDGTYDTTGDSTSDGSVPVDPGSDPTDPAYWVGNGDSTDGTPDSVAGDISCDGTSDCTITDENGNPHSTGEDPIPTWQHPGDVENPGTPPATPGTPQPPQSCTEILDQANALYREQGPTDKYHSVAWMYDMCLQNDGRTDTIARVDPSAGHSLTGPATSTAAQQATQALVQLHAATAAARTATQAAMKAAQQAGQSSAGRALARGRAPRKRRAAKRRG